MTSPPEIDARAPAPQSTVRTKDLRPWLPGPELSVVVPTFNERENVELLVARLAACLKDVAWEVIFVDDESQDGTAETVLGLARKDSRVRCLQRIGRRGLSTACVEGILASSAPYVAVIDADMQHDETLLPDMLAALRAGPTEIAIGSRYTSGGSTGAWNRRRVGISRTATRLSQRLFKADLTDPMSGFFMLRRELLVEVAPRLSGLGFKILLDIFASADRRLEYRELPYTFREREHGESKLDSRAVIEHLLLLTDKTIGRWVPVRFISFALVGTFGVLVHLAVLALLHKSAGASFMAAQTAATFVAMVGNFALNNAITYRDQRLKGWRWLKGLASFVLVCGIGAVANIGVAQYLFGLDTLWVLSGLAGVAVGAVWNFAVTGTYTWRRGARR